MEVKKIGVYFEAEGHIHDIFQVKIKKVTLILYFYLWNK